VLYDKKQTARDMYRLVNRYYKDLDVFFIRSGKKLVPISQLSFIKFYDMVKKLPYRKDIKPKEITARPLYLLRFPGTGLDCKKKSILIGSYMRKKNIPYRFIASSRKKNGRIHHVFPQVLLCGIWMNADATYSRFNLFEPKQVTRAEVL
jgi:hypothetical protein